MESLWLSGRASECGILRAEVRLLVRTQNFFFVPHLCQDEKHLSLLVYIVLNFVSFGSQMNHTLYFSITSFILYAFYIALQLLFVGLWVQLV